MTTGDNEFHLIARYFAPLAGPQGLNLLDDAALFSPRSGYELVLTADALIAGVHFRTDDPPDLIARKALRVNLSDLAAKGAEPVGYMLTIAWPTGTTSKTIEQFAQGLSHDQAEFGIVLFGGDTTVGPGPLTISITAIGQVPAGSMIRRSGAELGDVIFVSGTIGDGALGLDYPGIATLNQRYLVPEPRLPLGQFLRGKATSAIDVSDGLIADAGHIAKASGVCLELDLDRIPMSAEAAHLVASDQSLLARALIGGDDYEILFTVPSAYRAQLAGRATEIGCVTAGQGVVIMAKGRKGDPTIFGLGGLGYRHRFGEGSA